MAKLRLHLDADVSCRVMQRVLLERGHDVTRTPCEWMQLDASDEQQLLQATAYGRCILTFNIGDFMRLAQIHPAHGGIALAQQKDWNLPSLIAAVDRMLMETRVGEWPRLSTASSSRWHGATAFSRRNLQQRRSNQLIEPPDINSLTKIHLDIPCFCP